MLEVSPDASLEEIENAYRRLIGAWHPANYPPETSREILELAEERTKLLIEARQQRADPERPRAYDERRQGVGSARRPGPSPGGGGGRARP